MAVEARTAMLVAAPGAPDVVRVEEPAVSGKDVALNSPPAAQKLVGPNLSPAQGRERQVDGRYAGPGVGVANNIRVGAQRYPLAEWPRQETAGLSVSSNHGAFSREQPDVLDIHWGKLSS